MKVEEIFFLLGYLLCMGFFLVLVIGSELSLIVFFLVYKEKNKLYVNLV